MALRKLLVIGTIAALAAQSPEPRWPAGKKLSAADLIDRDSRPARLPAGLALLVYIPDTGCPDLSEQHRKAASAQRIALVPIAGEKCRQQMQAAPALFTVKGFGPSAFGLLTEDGILRRTIRTDQLNRMLAEVASWQGGRQIYDAQCARCHGPDGADMNYPFIKSLAGIGARASESKIIEMTEMTGAVDLHALNEKDRQALAAYVAGL